MHSPAIALPVCGDALDVNIRAGGGRWPWRPATMAGAVVAQAGYSRHQLISTRLPLIEMPAPSSTMVLPLLASVIADLFIVSEVVAT